MNWFLYDNGLRHERVNIRSEIWTRSLIRELLEIQHKKQFTSGWHCKVLSPGPVLGISYISIRVAWKNVPVENEENVSFFHLGDAAFFIKYGLIKRTSVIIFSFNPLSASPTKWLNTLKQIAGCCRGIA